MAGVQFKDSISIVVGASQPHLVPAGPPQTNNWPEASLLPGAYRATYIGRDGSVMDERPFDVKDGAVRLTYP